MPLVYSQIMLMYYSSKCRQQDLGFWNFDNVFPLLKDDLFEMSYGM